MLEMEWEYKVVTIPMKYGNIDPKSIQDVDGLGEGGWELVTVTPVLSNGNTIALLHHMRKQKEQGRRAGFAP